MTGRADVAGTTGSVLIVGAGPTGLTLACDLARRGVGVRIVEKSPQLPRSSRAKGPNPRSLEVLEDLGVLERVLAAGSTPLVMRKYRDAVAVADADPYAAQRPTPAAPYDRGWLMAQWRLEEILRERLAEFGATVELDTEITSYEHRGHAGDGPDPDSGGRIVARTARGTYIEADYLVGCDGGHSTVRKLMGATFEGTTHAEQVMVNGDVELSGAEGLSRDHWHQWFDEDGAVMLCPIPGTERSWWYQAGPERAPDGTLLPPSREGCQRTLDRHARLDGVRVSDAALLSTYRVNVRMVDRYREGRALLAGDAAHVHPIAGGLGMNTGIQDAFNLGWKLAAVLTGQAGAALLDTYEEERLPVAAWTLDTSSKRLGDVLAAIREPGGGLDAGITEETTALGLGYRWSSLSRRTGGPDTGLRPGDRAPDAPCHATGTGTPTRLFDVFAGPHFTLLGFGAGATGALAAVAARTAGGVAVRTCAVDAGPGTGLADTGGHARAAYGVKGDALVLVRPDNHVALFTTADDSAGVLDYLRGLGR
ncbi:FAD-dependent monooxygenase [Streptomyces sp. NPDC004111]|uniref:FAD-dependent monooxygenase n=1 Tax=Streptomyces sp. NPDC004111 TaxID=3364690 RepID=UPI0036A16A7C